MKVLILFCTVFLSMHSMGSDCPRFEVPKNVVLDEAFFSWTTKMKIFNANVVKGQDPTFHGYLYRKFFA